jgi:hypothetical protein
MYVGLMTWDVARWVRRYQIDDEVIITGGSRKAGRGSISALM